MNEPNDQRRDSTVRDELLRLALTQACELLSSTDTALFPAPSLPAEAAGEHPVPDLPRLTPQPQPAKGGCSLAHLSMAAAACLLFGIGIALWLYHPTRPSPPQHAARPENASKTLGGAADHTNGPVLALWDLPLDAEGVISVVEVHANGSLEFRPKRDYLCKPPDPARKNGPLRLNKLLFAADPNGDTVVWLLLTDRPPVEALKRGAAAFSLASDLHGEAFPASLAKYLDQAGFDIRAVGRLVIPSAISNQLQPKDGAK